MEYVWLAIIFFFGAALGSFLLVIADRYNTGLSFFRGRSVCFSCNTVLRNKDLIPILSFLFLKGRCRYCGCKIPKQAIITEILMGILSVLAAFKSGILFSSFSFPLAVNYLLLLLIFAAILLISIYDLRHFIIPDSFLFFLFIFSILFNFLGVPNFSFLSSLLFGIMIATPFFLIFLFSKGTWFGLGDVKYIFVLSVFLGISKGLSAVILSFWIGAVFSLLALLLKKINPDINLPLFKNNLTIKSEVPFGPFISAGIIISFCLNVDLFQTSFVLGAI